MKQSPQPNSFILACQAYQKGNYTQAVQFFEEAIKENPLLWKSALGVKIAETLVLSLDWQKIEHYLPPHSNILQTSGWLKSLELGKPVNAQLQPIPWYTYPAIEFIEDKINNDGIVFEYGSGQSTLWWAEKVNKLISIESNKDWFTYLQQNLIKDSKITLKLIEEKEQYIQAINDFPDKYFDVIVIDGDNRAECAKQAYTHLKSDGFLIFDDTDRENYIDILQELDNQGFYRIDFLGMTPSLIYKNCTSILFKNPNFLRGNIAPSQKESCVGKSFFQPDNERDTYLQNLDSLSTLWEELDFQEYNFIIFPNWEVEENLLVDDLKNTLKSIIKRLTVTQSYGLLIYLDEQLLEEIESFTEEIILSLMLEENIDIPDNLSINFVPKLNQYQWQFISAKIKEKVNLKYEKFAFSPTN